MRYNEIINKKPITIPYYRNKEKSPYLGSKFAQDIEPKGEYMGYDELNQTHIIPNFEYGYITFNNPLYVPFISTIHGGWKTTLSTRYNAIGKKLSDKIKKDGYDGIITYDNDEIQEIVNLSGQKTNILSEARIGAKELSTKTENLQYGFEVEFVFNLNHILDNYIQTVDIHKATNISDLISMLDIKKKAFLLDAYYKEWTYDGNTGTEKDWINEPDSFHHILTIVEENHVVHDYEIDDGTITFIPRYPETFYLNQSYLFLKQILEQHTGKTTDINDVYHKTEKNFNNYTIEPDSSIGAMIEHNEVGAEIVSPLFASIDELLKHVQIIFSIVDQYGSTTKKCGFHVSMSFKDNNVEVDGMKLALLIGDDYINDIFGRSESEYTRSVKKALFYWMKNFPKKPDMSINDYINDAREALKQQSHLSVDISHFNEQNGRVEFRMIGGKDYHKKFELIAEMVRRYAYAMNVVQDPMFDQKTFVKKFTNIYNKAIEKQKFIDEEVFSTYGLGNFAKMLNKNYPLLPPDDKMRYYNIKSKTNHQLKIYEDDIKPFGVLENFVTNYEDRGEVGFILEELQDMADIIVNNLTIQDFKTKTALFELRKFLKTINYYSNKVDPKLKKWLEI